ncbi:AMP-binding protein [Cohnella thailandensis]|uniref:AMP-binding protein n=1 Tax=Cohnella thailandensis TaxID=557557 RepID=A0A841T5H7_9BACL|nr:AMP-binding protein [Cohnella thailandensis]MBB6637340.1 AMP-binding protein [Cohnella thailandensis]MBP1976668.1 long-chain acyl-CoA synthetase [Cohnella thailandensis]
MDNDNGHRFPGNGQPWWSKYPLLREDMGELPAGNAANGLLRAAERHPNSPAYRHGGRACSYAKLLRRSLRYANGLKSIGIKPGDRVAIYLPSVPDAIAAYYGVLLAGAVAVPFHENCGLEEAIRRTVETEAAAAIVGRSLVPDPESFREAAAVIKVIVIEERRGSWAQKEAARSVWSKWRTAMAKGEGACVNGLAFLRSSSPEGAGEGRDDGEPAVIQYTNGTTGQAKGAILTHGAVAAGAAQLAYWIKGVNAEQELDVLNAPVLHPAGLAVLNASVYRGGCLTISPSPMRPSGKYWLAEAASPALALPPRSRGSDGALGYPLPRAEARIVGEDSWDDLPPDTVGELAVRGPQTAIGYWAHDPIPAEGWIRTGDLARRDEEGCFYRADRKRNRLATAQGTMLPIEAESALCGHPAVLRACVIGVEEEGGSVSARALVVLRGDRTASAAQLDRWVRNRLGRKGVTMRYEFVKELPSTLWGEALKRELQPRF